MVTISNRLSGVPLADEYPVLILDLHTFDTPDFGNSYAQCTAEKRNSVCAFISYGISDLCQVQNRAFHSVVFPLGHMKVANPHCNGCQDDRSNIICGIVLTIVQLLMLR